MDNKDTKIINAIIENARIPISILAKKTRLSREVVQYRLNNLEKNLISGYQARINLGYFVDSIYTIYLNIQGNERKEIISKIKKLLNVHWIGSTLGKFNYIISFSVNKENSLNNFLSNLSESFRENQIQYILTQQTKEYKDSFSGLFGNNEVIVSQKGIEKIKIDDVDREIIDELTKNARSSNEEIGEKVGLTRESVRNRIKELEKSKVLINFRTIIKPQELNLISYVVAIKSKTLQEKELDNICTFLSSFKEFSYVCQTAGEINILSVVSTKDLRELDEICTKIRDKFSNLLAELDVFPLIEVGSQDYLPRV